MNCRDTLAELDEGRKKQVSNYNINYRGMSAELSDDVPNDANQPKGTGKARYRIGSVDEEDWTIVDCAGWPDLERIVKRNIDQLLTGKGAGNR